MTAYVLILCVLAGLFFGGWPLLMRASGVHFVLASLVLQLGSICVFLPVLKGKITLTTIMSIGIVVALSAGLLNGFGQLAFQKLIAMEEVEIARAMILVVVAQIATTALGARIFYAEPFGPKKITGFFLALIAVKLLIGK